MKRMMIYSAILTLLLVGCHPKSGNASFSSSSDQTTSATSEDTSITLSSSSIASEDSSSDFSSSATTYKTGNQNSSSTEKIAEKPASTTSKSAISKYANIKVNNKFGKWPVKSGKKYYNSKVGTWFTVWWTDKGESTHDHWYAKDWTRLKPVEYGYYSSGDTDYLNSVLTRMYNIGIDYILLDDTNGHWNDGGYIASNMDKCFSVANSLKGKTPKIGVATGAPLREGNIMQQKNEADEYYSEYFLKFPNVYFNWKGKPLLVTYVAGSVNTAYIDERFTIRKGTGFISWQGSTINEFKTLGNWGWVFDQQNIGSEIMGVQPGYNKAHQGTYIQPLPRENGKTYINMWLNAIKKNPETIVIPSYNDHAEETGWEATIPIRKPPLTAAQDTPDEDPFLYEKITEAYLALRYGYIDGFYYREESSSNVFQAVQGKLVNKTPSAKDLVIIVPDGYFAWEKAR